MSQCAICAKPMPEDARKCTECGSYQHPARRFFAGIDVRAWTALIPIVTLAYVFVADQFAEHKSDLEATAVRCQSDGIEFFASNLGDRAAILQSASYTRSNTGSPAGPNGLNFVEDALEVRMMNGGEARLIRLEPEKIGGAPGAIFPPTAMGDACQIAVKIDAVAFDHDAPDLNFACVCGLN